MHARAVLADASSTQSSELKRRVQEKKPAARSAAGEIEGRGCLGKAPPRKTKAQSSRSMRAADVHGGLSQNVD